MICLSGHRSPRQAQALAGMGYTNVTNVHGGLIAWKKAGLPVKRTRAAGAAGASRAPGSDASATAGGDAHLAVLSTMTGTTSCRR